MKNLIHISIFLILLVSLIGCESDIEIEVDDAQIKPVVEAKLSNHEGDARVTLFYSQNLMDETDRKPISDAKVTIIDLENNTRYDLLEKNDGMYENYLLKGSMNHTYKLEILLPNGETLTSLGTMPMLTPLDDIHYELADDVLQDDDDDDNLYKITPDFTDIPNIKNYYQLEIIKNRHNKKGVNVFKDLGFDGLANTQQIYLEAKILDTLSITLHNIDEHSYNYIYAIANIINQGSGSPTNPVSNIEGDALGYFKVYSYENQIEIILKE
ncbi:MAG: DUF4249 domain-containing protein [Weeksellaceae bacterium]